ncbi:prostaglandin reductase 1-like [Diorhabda sublineata]|uniref:prostaglandin reductase 1-like n=1 Tax=Diorhabda sublineata TaxID=1163346 RepID=UPI0024E08783|nr:prostaglandin reductase 1-like [Diorhabda sublineata]
MINSFSKRSVTNMVKAKLFVLDKHFDGWPKESDLKIVEEELPPLKNGEFLAEAVYLSVDPYMRAYEPSLSPGQTFIGTQIAKIIDSKNPKYPVGEHVIGQFGWRTHTISTGEIRGTVGRGTAPQLVSKKLKNLPLSLALGAAGMTGNSAYFGFLEICHPKAGETVVVSGAAGGVGNQVGQIAKIKGCKVIGIAGSDDKGKWLTDELGFDHFINYKTDNVAEALKKFAPNGVDCYFDNVGGEISTIVISQMNDFGRVSKCGSISGYNEAAKNSSIDMFIIGKQLRIEGFLVTRWIERWHEGIEQNIEWLKEGKLKYRETVTEGFGNMFKAFVEMLKGVNVGKAIVKV